MTRFFISIFLIGLGLFFAAPEMVESIFARDLVDEATVPKPLKVLGGLMVLGGVIRLFDISFSSDAGGNEEDAPTARASEPATRD